MKDIDIKVFPASYGDSILITCHGIRNTHILVDMGFMSTYDKHIKKELRTIQEKGEKLSLLVFTHTDEDHILGGIKFIQENCEVNESKIIFVDEIWHNSYRHLQFEKIQKLKDKEIARLTSALKSMVNRGHIREKEYRTVDNVSLPQGSTLSSLLLKNDYESIWNKSYSGEAIMEKTFTEQGNEVLYTVHINKEVKITVLSPSIQDLKNLDDEWEKILRKLGYSSKIDDSELMDDAFEIYMASLQDSKNKREVRPVSHVSDNIENIANAEFIADTSAVNGSSIAFILEFYDKKLLFLGDSHSDTVEQNLRRLLKERNLDIMHFDAVKISHHGSKHNTSINLLKLFEADRYIISTNGRGRGNNHPDIECIYRILTSHPEKKKELIFNYKPVSIISRIDKQDLKNRLNYSIKYKNDPKHNKCNEITYIPIKDVVKNGGY